MLKGKRLAVGVVATCAIALLFLATPYYSVYPVIPWAIVTVDGNAMEGLPAYLQLSGRTVVVIRRSPTGLEAYFVNIGGPNSTDDKLQTNFVTSCDESKIFVHRLFVIQNHEQMCHPLMVTEEKYLLPYTTKMERNLNVSPHAIEFSADDGKRIRMRW